jgi:uncharacterized cupredoxin-like copper-binding protein
MKNILMTAAFLALLTGAANAAGSHAGGHGEAEGMAIGRPGKAAEVSRTVTIRMVERDDGAMAFEPASLAVTEGETIRLEFVNEGELDHEFVMDTHEGLMEHKALMERFPEMEHDDPNSIRLAPGARGEIVWTFATSGEFGFGCLIPGHYDSGMKGGISVRH